MPAVDVSLAGAIVALAILSPSLVLLVAPPRDDPPAAPDTPRVIALLERAGQAGCLVVPAFTAGRPEPNGWLAVIAVLIAAYYGLWTRYLLADRRFAVLYAPFGPVPIPMAVLPVLAFFGLAAWAGSWPTAVAATVLAVGHLVTASLIARTVQEA